MPDTFTKVALTGIVAVASAMVLGCGDDGGRQSDAAESSDTGVDVSTLSPTIDNPYVAFSTVRRSVYEGNEVDAETGESVAIGVVSTPRRATTEVGGAEVTVVDVADSEDGAVIERTEDYYAQTPNGDVYYMGEQVDDIENGEVVGHHGQWEAGTDGARAGVFMPSEPGVGDEFEQERAPGIAEDRSTIVATGLTVRVPAGTFEDCIETEDVDPLGDAVEPERKFYCPGVGLVREKFPAGGSLDLVEVERA